MLTSTLWLLFSIDVSPDVALHGPALGGDEYENTTSGGGGDRKIVNALFELIPTTLTCCEAPILLLGGH